MKKLALILLILFTGCATPSKPSPVYTGPLPDEVSILEETNPVLAKELRKLPELQDGVSPSEMSALKSIAALYQINREAFEKYFEKMYRVGKPETRKYCTPLQSLLWLCEKEEYKAEKDPNPAQYSLKELLAKTWDFSDKSRWGKFKVVTERLNAPELVNYYSQMNFGYVRYGQQVISAQYIFYSKKGCCQDYTAFGVYCLQKAGYDARAITIKSPTGYHRNHVVCEYTGRDGKKYILDNSCNFCTDWKGIEEKEIYTKKFPQVGVGYW